MQLYLNDKFILSNLSFLQVQERKLAHKSAHFPIAGSVLEEIQQRHQGKDTTKG